jgi:hypothetical protein
MRSQCFGESVHRQIEFDKQDPLKVYDPETNKKVIPAKVQNPRFGVGHPLGQILRFFAI